TAANMPTRHKRLHFSIIFLSRTDRTAAGDGDAVLVVSARARGGAVRAGPRARAFLDALTGAGVATEEWAGVALGVRGAAFAPVRAAAGPAPGGGAAGGAGSGAAGG